MERKTIIALLGGDLRQYATAIGLARKGWQIRLWGIEKQNETEQNIVACHDWKEAIHGSTSVILPLPISTDGIILNCPLCKQGIPVSLMDISSELCSQQLVIGGKMPSSFCRALEAKAIKYVDYCGDENFQMENAYLTAEAALGIAMNHLDQAMKGASFAVVGFGRIAKHLVFLLLKFGAKITVAARKESDLALAKSLGCSVIFLHNNSDENLMALTKGFDVIYNTVPVWLFDRSFLELVDPHTFMIDLASAPGGFDVCAAKELKSKVLWATSLPGKYAPKSAGSLICECVNRILTQEVAL